MIWTCGERVLRGIGDDAEDGVRDSVLFIRLG